MDVDESQEANVKGNQAANDVRKTLPRASYRKEPYMDDSCKLSVRGLTRWTEDSHSEGSERARARPHGNRPTIDEMVVV